MDIALKITKEYDGKILMSKILLRNKLPDGRVTIAKTHIDGQSGYIAYIMDTEGNKLGLYPHR